MDHGFAPPMRKAILFLGFSLVAVTPPLLAVPTTTFVHALSASEIPPDPTEGFLWHSPWFEFGEHVVLDAGDSLNLRVDFAGTQFLEFGVRTDGENVGIEPLHGAFTEEFSIGGTWTFLGAAGDLLHSDVSVRISNIPILVVQEHLVGRGGSASFTGVEVALLFPNVRGSLDLDGFSLYLRGGDVRIGGSASPVPEPGTLMLIGAGLGALGLRRRRP